MKVSAIVALIASAQAVQLTGADIYDTVAAGYENQQPKGQKFERPDTGLDDDTVLAKRAGAGHHYPHFVAAQATQINGDSGLYDSVASGWTGKQVGG